MLINFYNFIENTESNKMKFLFKDNKYCLVYSINNNRQAISATIMTPSIASFGVLLIGTTQTTTGTFNIAFRLTGEAKDAI